MMKRLNNTICIPYYSETLLKDNDTLVNWNSLLFPISSIVPPWDEDPLIRTYFRAPKGVHIKGQKIKGKVYDDLKAADKQLIW